MRAILRLRLLADRRSPAGSLGAARLVAARAALDEGRGHGAPVLLRIGLGGLPRAAGAVAALESAAARAPVRPRQARVFWGLLACVGNLARRACCRGPGRSCRARPWWPTDAGDVDESQRRRRDGFCCSSPSACPFAADLAASRVRATPPETLETPRGHRRVARPFATRCAISPRRRGPRLTPAPRSTPGVTRRRAGRRASTRSWRACDGFLAREAIAAEPHATTSGCEILRGMILTRAVDTRLKAFFTGSEVRYGSDAVSRQGLPIARPGSDLRRRDSAAPRRGVGAATTARGRATSSGRSSATSARRSRCGRRAGDRAHGAQRADGQGRPADGRPRPAHRRLRLGHRAGVGAALDQQPHGGRHGAARSRSRARRASPCRSSARADRRSANGTRRSTCARRASCR